MSKKNKAASEIAQAEKASLKGKGKERQMDEAPAQDIVADDNVDAADDDDDESLADEEGASEGEDESKPLDLDKIRKRMHYAVRQMSQKAKQARKFELQKQIKRIKSCREPSEKSALEAQLATLKTLDLQSIAASALLNKLGKSKLIPRGGASAPYKTSEAQAEKKGVDEWPVMVGVWGEEALSAVWMAGGAADEVSTEAGKARAKLLSHKLLAEESGRLTEILSRLAGRERVKPQVKEPMPAEREWSGSEDEGSDDQELEADSESGDDEEDVELDEDGVRARIEQLGDLDQWDALVAAGSSGEESDDDEEEEQASPPRDKKRKRSPSPQPDKKGKKKQAVVAAPAAASSKKAAESGEESSDSDAESDSHEENSDSDSDSSSTSSSSHYLPTLSHGYLPHALRTKDDDFSGSEDGRSDGSGSIDSDIEDTIQGKAKGSQKSSGTRKNRMGQRARKALWEKKYGKNANHVKLLAKEKKPARTEYKPLRRGRDGKPLPEFEVPKSSDAGWKRFPVPAAGVAEEKKEKERTRTRLPPQQSTRSYAPPTKPAFQKSEPAPTQQQELHPSWVAKQKQKEKEEMVARALQGGGGGAGKKVVFD